MPIASPGKPAGDSPTPFKATDRASLATMSSKTSNASSSALKCLSRNGKLKTRRTKDDLFFIMESGP